MTKISFKNNILGQYLLLLLLIFAFVTYPGANEVTEDPVVWYYNGLPILLATALTIIYISVIIITRRIKIDKISLFLFTRLSICIIPIFYISSLKSFSAHYPVVILTLLAYLIGRSSSWHFEKQVGIIVIAFGLILSFQVIQTFLLIPINYFDLLYKNHMQIPIAASNVIAAYLTPILFLFLFNYRPNIFIKIFVCIIFIAAIILTKSRGGIIVGTITYLTYLIFFKYNFKFRYILLVGLLLSLGIYFVLEIPEVKILMLGFSADDTSFDANSLSSNRLEIYGEEIERFLKHPLFGNGMVFNQDTAKTGSHNLVIELLVQSGIIGTIFYIIPLIIILKKIIKNFNYPNMRGWALFLIAMLYHGMIEVNFFNYSTDIIFWCVCGLIMTAYNKQLSPNGSNSIPKAISAFKQ